MLTPRQEAAEGVITLVDDLPNIVNGMLRFLYSTDYDDEASKNEDGSHALSFNVHMFAIADKVSKAPCELSR